MCVAHGAQSGRTPGLVCALLERPWACALVALAMAREIRLDAEALAAAGDGTGKGWAGQHGHPEQSHLRRAPVCVFMWVLRVEGRLKSLLQICGV